MNRDRLENKVVLVTGGTGSFGQSFVGRLIADSGAQKIIILSRDEFKQHQMQLEFSDERLRFFLGDVRDVERLRRAFRGVDVVVHAAALKQVPALEYNPLEAVKTNIWGTQNVIDAALDAGVEKVLFVSTDKAVNPVNLYGATKLCAEKLVIAANAYSGAAQRPVFSVVRYGNVIASRGSFVETIAKQRAAGVVTLTHTDMTRFWLKLEDAHQLVMHALSNMRGGEIFVPKVPSMKVSELVQALAPACEIRLIGIRPGEKMHEALLTENEVRRTKDVGFCYVVEPEHDWWRGEHVAGYASLPENFVYTSNTNTRWLQPEEMRQMVGLA
jgi:UDP-N-acetylglucosamine 4,6-dehydratase